jgi:2-polyprenyl-6-methoxyphenol hydroxylase-like FAD-dependent oxidoreductase
VDADVIVVGAGPVGLALAAELALLGADALVLEALAEPSPHSRAFGLHARSTEAMELRGLLPRLEAEAARSPLVAGLPPGMRTGIPLAHFAGIRTVRLDAVGASRPGMLPIAQTGVEAVLGARAVELGATVRRGVTVTGLAQDADGATVSAADGRSWRARFVVGCDGGRSAVRKLAGFAFPGSDPTITGRLAEVAVPDLMAAPGLGWHRCVGGILQVMPGRVLAVEFDGPPADRDDPVTVAEVAGSVGRIVGRPVAIPGEPTWMTRFTDNTRLAADYRAGRVLLCGDAAHVHSPFGGQGLNLGLQDAVNLGWKLAAAVAGHAPDGLLDSYAAERRPVAARVLHNTRAQVALMHPDAARTPLYELFAQLMDLPTVNRYLADMIAATDVRYGCGGFVPDLVVAGKRVREMLADGRAVLLDVADDPGLRAAAAGWADRVDVVSGPADRDSGPLLVRPDGYLAWAGEGDVRDALERWFGRPAR